MNSEKFSGSRSKVARARRHIEELEQNTNKFFNSVWYCLDFCSEDELDAKGIYLTIKGRPKDYSVIVGDVVHNLRAALDLMAVDVVSANGGNTKDVYFPFSASAAKLDEQIKNKNFHRAAQPAIDQLKYWQPYKGGNEALRGLHDLDVSDKHKTLIPAHSLVTMPPICVLTDENGKPVGFDEGKLRLWVDTSVEPKVTHVFPNDFPFCGQPILPTLHSLSILVDAILLSFETLVP